MFSYSSPWKGEELHSLPPRRVGHRRLGCGKSRPTCCRITFVLNVVLNWTWEAKQQSKKRSSRNDPRWGGKFVWQSCASIEHVYILSLLARLSPLGGSFLSCLAEKRSFRLCRHFNLLAYAPGVLRQDDEIRLSANLSESCCQHENRLRWESHVSFFAPAGECVCAEFHLFFLHVVLFFCGFSTWRYAYFR